MKGLVVYMSIGKNDSSCFLLFDNFVDCVKYDLKQEFNEKLLDKLIVKSLVVTIKRGNEIYVYKDEVTICKDIMHLNYNIQENECPNISYDGGFLVECIKIERGTFFCYNSYNVQESKKAVPVFVRNIIYMFKDKYKKCDRVEFDVFGITIITYNMFVVDYIENALYRKHQLEQVKSSNFANSSAYMGSKKSLVGFIVEALWPHVETDSVILDIMCGSGAVSNALVQMGNVYASDAQFFCRLLAKIQGAGFNYKKALEILNQLYIYYMENMRMLQNECKDQLEFEKEVFHMDMSNPVLVLAKYQKYVESVNLYSSTDFTSDEIKKKIQFKKLNNKDFPYCLFTYYFSNVYFGLEQCMQIDSIRFALDTIQDEETKNWVLGVLVVTVSAIASNHAGHFAQPKRVDEKSISAVIEKRKKSVWLEFSKRLLAIATESERYLYNINIVDGPWENALEKVSKLNSSNLIVYLDAPYKRDEYSRYYHVLETVALYDYPASERKGRLRSKLNGERFKTEFFSKNINVIENNLNKTIVTILQTSRVCVWSYSDNGAASISNVVNMVLKEISCKVYFYSIPHKHSSQRKKEKTYTKSSLAVIEYCIVFVKQL